MQHTYLGPPVLVIMLAAASWAWWHAERRPESVMGTRSARVRTAMLEGCVCWGVWSSIHFWVQQALAIEVLLNGLLVGCIWAGTAWWSRERFAAARRDRWSLAPPPDRSLAKQRGQQQANGAAARHAVKHTTVVQRPEARFRIAPSIEDGASILAPPGTPWTLRISYATIALLSGAGTLLFWTLLGNLPVPQWSRAALVLQLLAGGLAALFFIRCRLSARAMLYPLLLALVIYTWDTTLPPPTLPGGVLRDYLPHVVVVGLLIDLVATVGQRRTTRPRSVQIYAGFLSVEDAAALLGITVNDVRMRLQQAGRTAIITPNGNEALSLDDVRAITME